MSMRWWQLKVALIFLDFLFLRNLTTGSCIFNNDLDTSSCDDRLFGRRIPASEHEMGKKVDNWDFRREWASLHTMIDRSLEETIK